MSDQVNHNPEGEKLALHFNVIANVFEGQEQFRAELILTNQSAFALKNNWSIYFNFLRKISSNSISSGFEIEHINGDYFSLKPTKDYNQLAPGGKIKITFTASFWAIKKIDAPTGFYIVYHDKNGNEIKPQALPFLSIENFNRPEQVVRKDNDKEPIPTPESRFNLAKEISVLPKQTLTPIMPTPVFFEKKDGGCILTASSIISYQSHLKNEAQYLSNFLNEFFGLELEIIEGQSGDIKLLTERVKVDNNLEEWNSEAYTMNVDSSGVNLIGAGAAAVFYAIQSFFQLLSKTKKGENVILEVPCIIVEDKPQFKYRGVHLDVSRNFHGVHAIKKLLNMLSIYKINKFHFHLTDDEGWRIEIPGLPELTEVGARRGHTHYENDCLFPSYGSGFDPNNINSAGNGYYTRDEFIALLRYAHERHIEVIPAIDYPGHARAAVRAMEVRHDKYNALGETEKASEYLLTDWDDKSEYESVQMWHKNVINIGLPSTYRFIEKITDELIKMYNEADVKLSAIHVGGDEVPAGSWLKSPVCLNLMKAHPELKNIHDLTEYFMAKVNAILASKGVRTAGWEEIVLTHKKGKAEPNPALLKHNLIAYTWNTVWGEGGEKIPYRLANMGYDIVLANAPNLYFDLAYDKDPEESGYYWAGYTNTEDTFKFLPLDFFKSAEKDGFGNIIDAVAQYQDVEKLTEKGKNNVLGIQAQLWGETILTDERIEYLLFPRLCALAERAWAKEPSWGKINDPIVRKEAYQTDWNQFVNRLSQKELPRLDFLFGGVKYHIPQPGAKLENGVMTANTSFPGFPVKYTTDGTEPTKDSQDFDEPLEVNNQQIKLKTFASNGRSSRTTILKN